MTQSELASITNASLRQVSGTMRDFARAGLIELGYGAIRMLDEAGLRARADLANSPNTVSL